LIQIFNALLSIARAEAGAGREGMIDFDAGSVARDVGELYEPVAEERGVALSISSGTGLTLHGSRELVGQALANLVDNALTYAARRRRGKAAARASRRHQPPPPSNSRRGEVAAMSNSSSRIMVRDRRKRSPARAQSIRTARKRALAAGLRPRSFARRGGGASP